MSDLNFELQIDKYTPKELETLLSLKFPYTPEDIEDNITLLKNKILSDKNLEENKQQEIITFLRKLSNKLNKALLDKKNRMKQNVITQYGSQFIIDRNSQRARDPDGIPPSVKINPYRTGPGDSISMLTGWEDGTTTHLLSIDSRFRNQYFKTSSCDFLVTLPLSITNVVSMELVALETPATYFAINKRLGNNYFHIAIQLPGNPATGQGVVKITMPDGNYSRPQMQETLNLMLSAAIYPAAGVINGVDCRQKSPQAIIDKVSGRTIIDLNPNSGETPNYPDGGLGPFGDDNSSMELYFNFRPDVAQDVPFACNTGDVDIISNLVDKTTPIQLKLGWVMGYRAAIYQSSFYKAAHGNATITHPINTDASGNSYVSEGIYDGWGSRYFYFVVDDFNKNSVNGIDAVLNASVIGDNILARLTRSSIGTALNVGFTLDSALLKSDDATRKRVYFGPINIKKLHFKVLDAYGRVVDLNNMDISFALRLDRLYD